MWDEHVLLEICSSTPLDSPQPEVFMKAENHNLVEITDSPSRLSPSSDLKLRLFLPELSNVHVALMGGSIRVFDKIEGDCSLSTENGNIEVKTLR